MTDIAEFEQPEFDPSIEPESSKAWLNLIEDAEKAFKRYQEICDNIDKKFADLERMASAVTTDREFQLFWANIRFSAHRSTLGLLCLSLSRAFAIASLSRALRRKCLREQRT